MAHLARQVEQVVLLLHEVAHAVRVPHVGDIDPQAVLDAGPAREVPHEHAALDQGLPDRVSRVGRGAVAAMS